MSRLILAVSQNAVVQAESTILGCDQCSTGANVPFWQVLDTLRNHQGLDITYILPILACCPNCKAQVDETTLIEPKASRGVSLSTQGTRSAEA